MKYIKTYKIFESIKSDDISKLEQIVDILQETFDKYEIVNIPYGNYSELSNNKGSFYIISQSKHFMYPGSDDHIILIYIPTNVNNYYLYNSVISDIKDQKYEIEEFIDRDINISKNDSAKGTYIYITL